MKFKLQKKHLPKFKRRPLESHKYDYGNVYVFGGSVGYFGAPQLAALAAYRSGSGLVHIVVPEDIYESFPKTIPEVMVHPYHDTKEVGYMIGKADALLFGPGLNPYDDTQKEVLKILLESKKPLVIDASGLAFLKPMLPDLTDEEQVVVTPHVGEAKELFDDEEPLRRVGELTHKKMTVVLKSHETHIFGHHKHYLAVSGNPGMATAGCGDVLAGMILSYLGQGHKPVVAATIGVYLHQLAGGKAKDELGEDSMTASDVINHISSAIKTLK